MSDDIHEIIDYDAFDYGDPVAKWFAEEAYKIKDTAELIKQTGERLVAAGIPLLRLAYFQRTLHPDVFGKGYFWRRGEGINVQPAAHDLVDQAEYADSPILIVFKEKKSIRVRLENIDDPGFELLRDFKREGATDYIVMPVPLSDDNVDGLSVTTDAPGGFSKQHLDRLLGLHRLFARVMEIHGLRDLAQNMLDVYVGHDAGERILKGQIRRGDNADIHSIIWYSDLRSFSTMSEELPRQELIELLNEFFEATATPVMEHGGEVVKFVGDAMLAIFRIENDAAVAEQCAAALSAAREAMANVDAANVVRREAGNPTYDFGLALDVGVVMFGNIGAPGRLDFTVIGPTVNRVTRVQDLCRVTGQRFLATADFAAQIDGDLIQEGVYQLKGATGEQVIFRLPGSEPGTAPGNGKVGEGNSAASVTTKNAVNLSILAEFTGHEPDIEREILELYVEHGRKYIERIGSSETTEDWRTAAHSLKGASRGIGASDVERLAALIEALDPEEIEERAELAIKLLQTFGDAELFIKEHLEGC